MKKLDFVPVAGVAYYFDSAETQRTIELAMEKEGFRTVSGDTVSDNPFNKYVHPGFIVGIAGKVMYRGSGRPFLNNGPYAKLYSSIVNCGEPFEEAGYLYHEAHRKDNPQSPDTLKTYLGKIGKDAQMTDINHEALFVGDVVEIIAIIGKREDRDQGVIVEGAAPEDLDFYVYGLGGVTFKEGKAVDFKAESDPLMMLLGIKPRNMFKKNGISITIRKIVDHTDAISSKEVIYVR